MTLKRIHLTFAYEFAYRVVSVVRKLDDEPYAVDFLDPRTEDFLRRASRPHKDTLLHLFIRNLNYADLEKEVRKFPEGSADRYAALIDSVGLPVPAWLNSVMLRDHAIEMDSLVEQATAIVADATFHLLFFDREFLVYFQNLVAEAVADLAPTHHPRLVTRAGVLRRPSHLPKWLTHAVFHRDKGLCQHCHRDLTGTVNIESIVHLDHILPLAQSGSNDPTNFQLLCSTCNRSKGSSRIVRPPLTMAFW